MLFTAQENFFSKSAMLMNSTKFGRFGGAPMVSVVFCAHPN